MAKEITKIDSNKNDNGSNKEQQSNAKVLNVSINMSSPVHERNEQITYILKQFCPFLFVDETSENDSDNDDDVHYDDMSNALTIKPLTGGLSNHLFIVSSSSSSKSSSTTSLTSKPKSVLVRIHPDQESAHIASGMDSNNSNNNHHPLGMDKENKQVNAAEQTVPFSSSSSPSSSSPLSSFSLVDRSIENNLAIWLSQQQQQGATISGGDDNDDDNKNVKQDHHHTTTTTTNKMKMAPIVYGRFYNGRVEEFYDNVRPLAWKEMKHFIPQISVALANFHSLQAPPDVLPKPTPKSKSSTMTSSLSSSSVVSSSTSSLFRTVDEWIVIARTLLVSRLSSSSIRPSSTSDNVELTSSDEQSTASSSSDSTNLVAPDEVDSESKTDPSTNNQKNDNKNKNDATTSTDAATSAAVAMLDELEREWKWLSNQLLLSPFSKSFAVEQSSNTLENSQYEQPKNQSQVEQHLEQLAYDFIRQIVVTHMDCQPLNILVDKDDDDDDDGINNAGNNDEQQHHRRRPIRLIDFEYAGWNTRASDIANTFCEFCEMSNLCADYDKEYPTLEQQVTFFKHYCQQAMMSKMTMTTTTTGRACKETNDVDGHMTITEQTKNQFFYEILQSPDDYPTEWSIISNALSREVGRFSLVSHLSWSIWSIVKSQEEDGIPDFDYMVYAQHRIDGYNWAKHKFCSSDC